jgi:hypothetical protein
VNNTTLHTLSPVAPTERSILLYHPSSLEKKKKRAELFIAEHEKLIGRVIRKCDEEARAGEI